jgi:hypothetical protein
MAQRPVGIDMPDGNGLWLTCKLIMQASHARDVFLFLWE